MKYDFCGAVLHTKSREIDCLLFETNHDRKWKDDCNRLGYTVFELRHSSEDWSVPCCIENNVVVDFWGYMAVGNQDDAQFMSEWIAEDGYIGINSSMFSNGIYGGEQELPTPA